MLTYNDLDAYALSLRIKRYHEGTEDTLTGEEIAEMIFGPCDSDAD